MTHFFAQDGPLFVFLNKAGKIIVASVLWVIGCIPILTIGTSTAALYYTTVKAVRRDAGYVHKEFFRAYKRNLVKGIISTLIIMFFCIIFGAEYLLKGQGIQMSSLWRTLSKIVVVALFLISFYLFPVMSRFEMSLGMMWNLAFVMSIRHIHITIALAAGVIVLSAVQFFLLPMTLVVVMPGIWCYLSSFLIERVMKTYMPKTETENKQWYDE